MYVKNATELIDNGKTQADREARRVCLGAVEAALKAVEPARLIKSKLSIAGSRLIVDDSRFDLAKFRRILVIGGGKAAGPMAKSLESIMGRWITAGMVSVPESSGPKSSNTRIKFHPASHPLPGRSGVEGVGKMLGLVGTPTRDDLVICLTSGGGSSLLPLPIEGIALTDKVKVTRGLMLAGATIQELNVVRKHLSSLKGGRLAERLYPATVLSLVISDVVGDRLDSIASGPLYPDTSTYHDAIEILKRFNLWKGAPTSVVSMLTKGARGRVPETPKPGSRCFEKVTNIVLGSNDDAANAAVRYLRWRGTRPVLLSTSLEGEARFMGMSFGSVLGFSGTKQRPCSFVIGGETTVTVVGRGRGGRNQEFALGAALKMDGNQGVAMVALGTDGRDGPTDAAGAVVDGHTIRRGRSRRLSAEDILRRNDTYRFFGGLRDLVVTGPTGTNVNDLAVGAVV